MGTFAKYDDVAGRYEGTIPADRRDWVELRIDDVEAELTRLVPSLLRDDITPDRKARATRLVADKVLELYRNPDGTTSRMSVMGPFTDQRTGSKETSSGKLVFTDEELASVRLTRRPRIGTMQIAPWRIPR